MNYGSFRRIDIFLNKYTNLARVRTISHVTLQIKIHKN